MPQFQLRWVNRSNPGAVQDWQIGGAVADNFQLQQNYERAAALNINNNANFMIAVSSANHFAAATLTYTAATNQWTINGVTPNEFQLAVGAGIVTVRCVLNNVQVAGRLEYTVMEPAPHRSEAA
jgi:hypothetical protein